MAFKYMGTFRKLSISLPLFFLSSISSANVDQEFIEDSIKSSYNTVYSVTKNISSNVMLISANASKDQDKDQDVLDSSILDAPIYEVTYPNTVKGLKQVAKVGDFVMLKGYFFNQADDLVYEFHDDQDDAVFVEFDELPENFSLGEYYLLWARVTKNDKQTFIKGLSLSN